MTQRPADLENRSLVGKALETLLLLFGVLVAAPLLLYVDR